jgi:hypothetical protein
MKMLKSLIDVVAKPDKQEDNFGKDDDAVFGHYMVTEMRKITDPNAKLILKHTISNALFNARMGCLQPIQLQSVQQIQPSTPSQYFQPQQTINFPSQSYAMQQCNQYIRMQHLAGDSYSAQAQQTKELSQQQNVQRQTNENQAFSYAQFLNESQPAGYLEPL